MMHEAHGADRADGHVIRDLACVAALLLAVTSAAGAQGIREPAWPQSFQILQGDNASFGFIVTQPGLISVTVTASGAPVTVELLGPPAQSLRRSGTGALTITYSATAADVAKSSIWLARISESNPTQPSANRVPQVVATGSITVQHPPASGSPVRAIAAPPRAVTSVASAASSPTAAALAAAVATQKAAQQRTEELRLRALLTPVATGSQAAAIASRTPPGARITALSVSSGQPGDFVLISGSNFGDPGEVHFMVSPTMDVKALVNVWHTTQILVQLPTTITGVGAYTGQVYVTTPSPKPDRSAAVRFDFIPALEFVDRTFHELQEDSRVDRTDFASVCPGDYSVCRDGSGDVFGHTASDVYYLTTQLKNGWVVHEVNVNVHDVQGLGSAWAGVWESRVGTSSPYAVIRWHMDGLTSFNYIARLILKGPRGTSYF